MVRGAIRVWWWWSSWLKGEVGHGGATRGAASLWQVMSRDKGGRGRCGGGCMMEVEVMVQ